MYNLFIVIAYIKKRQRSTFVSVFFLTVVALLCQCFHCWLSLFLFNFFPYEQDDYYNILEKPIGPHLKNAIRTITAQGQQRQQMSRQIISSSSYGTMIPTSGMAQSASGNSRMPYMMDNTGGNSTAGVNN